MKFGVSYVLILLPAIALLLPSCKRTEDLVDFTEEDEISLGEKLVQTINQNPEFHIIPSEGNNIPYGYVNSRLLEITSSSVVSKEENFPWSIYLLEDDSRQAFAFPGGHIYVSTSMIFFLENEDQFSGLLAHLVSHVHQSHITEILFLKYGVNRLKSIARGGDQEVLHSIINDLDLADDFLQFTRTNEIQADTLTISILAETEESCESGGLFISRILNVQPHQQSNLISAHRLLDSRIENISQVVSANGCNTTIDDESASRFISFRNALP